MKRIGGLIYFGGADLSGDDALLESVLYELMLLGQPDCYEILDNHIEANGVTLGDAATLVDCYQRGNRSLFLKHAASVISACTERILRTREEAARNSYGYGGINACLIGAIASSASSDTGLDMWEGVTEFLLDSKVAFEEKGPVLDWLAVRLDQMPTSVLSAISAGSSRLKPANTGQRFFGEDALAAWLRFLCVTKSMSQSEAITEFVALSRSSEAFQRVEAARSAKYVAVVADPAIIVGCLLQMTSNEEIIVRAEAANGLTSFLTARADLDPLVAQRLVELLDCDGFAVPFAVLRGLDSRCA